MAAVLAVGLAAAAYDNGLHGPFVYDDAFEIVQNGSIRDLTNLPAIVRGGITRPLVNFSYAVDYIRMYRTRWRTGCAIAAIR